MNRLLKVLKHGTASWTFEFDNPMGAVRSTQRSKWVDPAAKRYEGYKRMVRLIANTAGVPDVIGKGQTARAKVTLYWEKRAKCDLDNAVKGILDALWKQDRQVMKIEAEAIVGISTKDYAEVTVEIG